MKSGITDQRTETKQVSSAAQDNDGPSLWWLAGTVGALLVMAVFLIGGFATGYWKVDQTAVAVTNPNGVSGATLNLVIVANKASLGPAYVPSSFTVPANSTVRVTVTDLDGATPLTGALVKYAKVTGTVGQAMQVQSINVNAPNTTTGPVRTMSQINPALVGHTLTIPQLGLNVPMAGQSRISFTLKTGKAGSYMWQCMDPCGSGTTGEGAPMGMMGYMMGTMTVAN